MATNFPNGIDIAKPLRAPSHPMTEHPQDHKNLEDAIEAIERKVGIDNSSDTNSLDYKVRQLQNFVNNFDEAVEDKIGTKIVAGPDIEVSYNDNTGNTTISYIGDKNVNWYPVNATVIGPNTFSFPGTSYQASQLEFSLFTCTTASQGQRKIGFIKEVTFSNNVITCEVITNSYLTYGDTNFRVSFNLKIQQYLLEYNLLGNIQASTSPQGIQRRRIPFNGILLPYCAYLRTLPTGGTISGYISVNGITDQNINRFDFAFNTEVLERQPEYKYVIEGSPLEVYITGSSGNPLGQDLYIRIPVVPISIFNFNNDIPLLPTKGYGLGGRHNSGFTNEIDGIYFSNETSFQLLHTFDTGRLYAAGVYSQFKGYGLGGENGMGEIDAVLFATDTSQSLSAAFATARTGAAGISSLQKGYGLGGHTGTAYSSEVDAIVFSNDTSLSLSSAFTTARAGATGVSASVKGYGMGGGTSGTYNEGNTPLLEIDDYNFISETSNSISAIFSTARAFASGVQSKQNGYALGGRANNTVFFNEIDKLDFITELSSDVSNTIQTNKAGGAGTSSLFKGYVLGGTTQTTNLNEINAFAFNSETSQIITATFNTARHGAAGVQFNSTLSYTYSYYNISNGKGYGLGGHNWSNLNEIDAIIFANDVSQSLSATFTTARHGAAGVSSSSDGYGLYGDGGAREIDSIVFVNETSRSLMQHLREAQITGAAGVMSKHKGYTIGGWDWNPNFSNLVTSLDFATEVPIVLSITLQNRKSSPCGVSSTTAGYSMGGGTTGSWNSGHSAVSDIDKLTYSNETIQLLSSLFTTARAVSAGVESNNKGYALGGRINDHTLFSEIDAIVFANDTSQSLSATYTTARAGSAGVSSLSKGYGMSGWHGTHSSEIDAIVFVDETSQSLSATFTTARWMPAGVQYNTV